MPSAPTFSTRQSRVRAAIAALILCTPSAAAGTSYSLTGFVAPELRTVFAGGSPDWSLLSTPDARLDVRSEPNDSLEILVAGELDARFDPINGFRLFPDARELWARAYVGDFTLTFGRQLFSWGAIGEFGVVDVLNSQQLIDMAQDWANRKRGAWSARVDWELDRATLELYLMPLADPASLPNGTPWLNGALTALAPVADRSDLPRTTPQPSLDNTQGAVRAYFSLDRADVAIAVTRLLDQVGLVAADESGELAVRYGRWLGAAAEASVPMLEGYTLGLESLLLLSEDDLDGSGNLVDGGQLHASARLKGFLSASLQFELGAFGRTTMRAQPNPWQVDTDGVGPVGNPWLLHEDLMGHLQLVYRFGDALHSVSARYLTALGNHGHAIEPLLTLRLLDGLLYNAGAQVFAGNAKGIGRIQDRSNLYTSFRVDF